MSGMLCCLNRRFSVPLTFRINGGVLRRVSPSRRLISMQQVSPSPKLGLLCKASFISRLYATTRA